MTVRFLARHFRSPHQVLVTDHPPHVPVAECLHALEPRHMFDAAGVNTGAEAAVDAVAQEQAEQAVDNPLNAADAGQASGASPADNADANAPLLEALATHQPPAGRREVVLIDTSVEDYQKLIAGIDPSAEVVLLDATRDGVEQIADALAGRSGIDAIHIISHGNQAELRLGTARLTLDSMTGRYVDELATISQALTDEADLLVYGCDFGQGQLGQEAATTLAKITGADVAASEDATGHATLGGDWDLEFRAGSVETTAVLSFEAQANFMGLLAAPSIDLDANNSSGTPGADYTGQYPVAAGGSLPVTDIDARLADADSSTLSSLTVTLSNRPNGANESLSADITGTSITASYDNVTGVLTLSGADTVGNYQRVLRTITYANAALAPDRTDRLITFVANDGTGDSNVGTTAVRWGYVRDDFTPSNYSGNDGIVNWNGTWQEHLDDLNPATGRVTVSGGVLDRDVSGPLGDSTLRGAHRGVDLSQAGTAILSLDYRASSVALLGNTNVQVQVSDDGGANWTTVLSTGAGTLVLSDTSWKTASIDISAYATADTRIRLLSSNNALVGLSGSVQFDNIQIDTHGAAPSLDLDADNSSGASGANFATTFTEDGGPVTVADTTDAIVSDADSTTLTELVVTIINPLDGVAESLSANTAGTSITASYDPATATLTLSGTDTVANYQQVLRTITYDNTSQNLNTTARTITFQASDGIDHGNVALATVTVNAVNDPPVVATTGSALAYTENDPASAVDSALTVSDVDNTTLTGATVTISANYVNGEDVLDFTDQLGITGSWNAATGTLTLTGTTTLANYQAALRTITYTNLSNGPSTLVRTVSVVVSDGSANSAVAARTITVTAVNDAPVANADAYAVAEDGTLNIAAAGVLTNDADVEGNPLTAVLVAGPANGALTLNADGSFSYTPNANFFGTDTFTYRANDGTVASALAATVTITVTAVNDAPVANADAYAVAEDGTLNIAAAGVLTNDTDVEGNPLTAVLVAGPANGALTLNADGSFSYTPNANFFGTDSFTYRANDSTVASALAATVTITVTAVNDAPVIISNGGGATVSVSIAENTTAVTTVAATDVDVLAQTLTYSIIGGADQTLFSINSSTGALTFNTAPDFEAPADANADNVYEVTVQASDGSLTDTQALSIAVIAAAPAGPAPPGSGGGIPEGSPSAPGSGPSSDDSPALGSEVDDGSSSKPSPVRKTAASDGSPVTVAQPAAVSRVDFRSKQDFSNDTSQHLGSKQPVAKETNAAAASAADVQDAKDPYSTLKNNRFLEELNRLRDNMNHQLSLGTLALSLGLSVGYAIWLLRGGALLSSLLWSLPAWRWLDPLPVLAHLRDSRNDEEENEDSLQAVLKNAEARDQSKPIPDVEVVPPAQQAATGAALSQPDATASSPEKADISV